LATAKYVQRGHSWGTSSRITRHIDTTQHLK
jgi:hypothetical protein